MINDQILKDLDELLSEKVFSKKAAFGNVIITGATGMLGLYLAQSFYLLRSRGNPFNIGKIYLVSRKLNSNLEAILSINRDVFEYCRTDDLQVFLSSRSIDFVIHAASPSNFSDVSKDPLGLYETNLVLTKLLLDNLDHGYKRFYFFSSGEIYGPNPKWPTSENDYSGFDPGNPRNFYGEFKKAAESLLSIYSLQSDSNFISLRIYHTFGPGLSLEDGRVFGAVLNSLVMGKVFEWKSDGSATRNFLYTKDLLQAILLTSDLRGFSAFNVAGTESITIRDFVYSARQFTSLDLFPDAIEDSAMPGSLIQTGDANTSKIQELGWTCTIDPKEAIRRTWESLKPNKVVQ